MTYRDPTAYSFEKINSEKTAGKKAEELIVRQFISIFGEKKVISCLNPKNKVLDSEQGTDFIYVIKRNPETNKISKHLRFDVTLNFKNKDNMPFIMDTDIEAFDGHTFKLGIRQGNKQDKFPKSVIVIGLDIKHFGDYEQIQLNKHAPEYVKKLKTKAVEFYQAYINNDVENIPLQINPCSKLSPRTYDEYNERNKTLQKLINLRNKQDKQDAENNNNDKNNIDKSKT